MRHFAIAVVAFAAFSAQAQGVFTAKSLMELDEGGAGIFILGWMAGYDSAQLISTYNTDLESKKFRVCLPPNTNGKIAYAVVQAHYGKLKNTQSTTNASAWDNAAWLPAGMFVHAALAAYWPCQP